MMDMSEVKAFNAELSGLYDNKPPISKAKMSAITRGAIKAIKFYKHVVHSVEKFIAKCKPEYKVPGLYVIDSIVRQSRHQFGQDKDVFAPRFAKNMQQTCANLFRCPPEDKRNIIRVLNLWQKNNVFGPDVIQPLLDMADPNHPIHQEIQLQLQQQQNSANGSMLNVSNAGSEQKASPVPAAQHTSAPPPVYESSGQREQGSGSSKFKKLLNEGFEYDSEDDGAGAELPPAPPAAPPPPAPAPTIFSQQQTAEALGSILTNPEILRQLQSLQAQMHMMTGMQNMMVPDIQLPAGNAPQMLPFLSQLPPEAPNSADTNDDGGNNESDIEFVEAGPQVIEIDANDSSRSPSPSRSRRRRSSSRSRHGSRRRSRSRSHSHKERRRDKDRERERDKDRERERDKDREREKDKDRERDKQKEKDKEEELERKKKGLPPIKKENLSVCTTTLWVGHLSKLATEEEVSALFGEIGDVVSIDLVLPRGCAYIVMERRRDAALAIYKLDKTAFFNKIITLAWAPGKGVKGREWKDYWERDLGVSYLPWERLQQQWQLGLLDMDALEEGGWIDEETLPPWIPSRSLTGKAMLESNLMMPDGAGVPQGLPPGPPPPLLGPIPMPVMPPRMPAGLPPGLAGRVAPTMGGPVPGITVSAAEGPLQPPPGLMGFPPGITQQRLQQPGMVGGFLAGMVGMPPGLMPGLPMHLPPPPALMQQASGGVGSVGSASVTRMDDAMDLDNEETHMSDAVDTSGDSSQQLQPPSMPEQLQAMMLNPPPMFSMPPPALGHKEEAAEQPASERDGTREDGDKDRERDRDRRERDRRDRDRRGDRDRRDDRRDRDRDRGRDRDRDRDDRRDVRDKDSKDKDKDRDRDRGRDRRDRDRDRSDRDRNRENRERSPRNQPQQPGSDARADTNSGGAEKSLQERLWEMANGNGKAQVNTRDQIADDRHRQDDGTQRQNDMRHRHGDEPRMDAMPSRMDTLPPRLDTMPPRMDVMPPRLDQMDRMPPRHDLPPPLLDNPPDMEKTEKVGGWKQLPPPMLQPTNMAPTFRADLRMRGSPRGPRGPWLEGIGPRFNGPPPFNRPPFVRPPFGDGPIFDGPPLRPPFSRPPFDGPIRPPFDAPNCPPFDGPNRPPFDGPIGPPFDRPGDMSFDGPQRFDGSGEFFERNGRPARFDKEREFGGWNRGNMERGEWEGPGRGDWDGEHDRRRDRDDRFRERNDRRRPRDDRILRDERPPRDDRPPRDERPPRDDQPPRDDRPPRDVRPPRDDRSRSDRDRIDREDRTSVRNQARTRDRDRKTSRWANTGQDGMEADDKQGADSLPEHFSDQNNSQSDQSNQNEQSVVQNEQSVVQNVQPNVHNEQSSARLEELCAQIELPSIPIKQTSDKSEQSSAPNPQLNAHNEIHNDEPIAQQEKSLQGESSLNISETYEMKVQEDVARIMHEESFNDPPPKDVFEPTPAWESVVEPSENTHEDNAQSYEDTSRSHHFENTEKVPEEAKREPAQTEAYDDTQYREKADITPQHGEEKQESSWAPVGHTEQITSFDNYASIADETIGQTTEPESLQESKDESEIFISNFISHNESQQGSDEQPGMEAADAPAPEAAEV